MMKSENLKSKLLSSVLTSVEMTLYVQEKFQLYETRARLYLIGSDRNEQFFRVLKFDRLEPSDLHIYEDRVVYSSTEVDDLLNRIKDGNKATGGLTFVTKAYGIAGCVKLLESYYLILITKRKQVGCICGNAIYTIQESLTVTVPHVSVQSDVAHSKTERRYKKLLSSVNLKKDFFFSYTYPIMQSLQKNVLNRTGMPYDNMFVWNDYLTQAIRSRCNNSIWTVALVHGYFEQARLSIFGRDFSVSLISRRSRYFAGTRYLKRGVNDLGKVANDVETEQIILDEEAGSYRGRMSSIVQVRGSIPLFWSQETSKFSPKPDIILHRYDPTYEATKLHFEDLSERYGDPVIVFNLIKTFEKRPREMILRREFANAVGYLNKILPEEKQVSFIHWDFHKFSKSKSPNKYAKILAILLTVARDAIDLTGFYYSGKPNVKKSNSASTEINCDDVAENENSRDSPYFQNGVLRTNCIDCVDRTNVAQYAFGLQALGCQLQAMGLSDASFVDPYSSIALALMKMYKSMGDVVAQQYGGSAAHNSVLPEEQGKWKVTAKSMEFLKSLKRYYSNTYKDGEKQDAMNLFLGYFRPQEGKPALWELESDYFLHVSDACSKLIADPTIRVERTPLRPLPACREDFSRIKLTSFDKLIEKTRSVIRNVRLSNVPNQKHDIAPDAAEIQLKSPNWLFGQRNCKESVTVRKATSHETGFEKSQDGKKDIDFYKLEWLSSSSETNEEESFQRYQEMASLNEENENGWCGGSLLCDFDENSEIYRHYAELCHIPEMEPFRTDPEREQHYVDILRLGSLDTIQVDDGVAAAEMEEALRERNQIGDDLGIIPKSCKFLAEDPSWLTRWLTGKEKVPR